MVASCLLGFRAQRVEARTVGDERGSDVDPYLALEFAPVELIELSCEGAVIFCRSLGICLRLCQAFRLSLGRVGGRIRAFGSHCAARTERLAQ